MAYNWASLQQVSSSTTHIYDISSMWFTCLAQVCCDWNHTCADHQYQPINIIYLSLSFLSLSLPMGNLSPLFCKKPRYYNFRKHVAGAIMSSVTKQFCLTASNHNISVNMSIQFIFQWTYKMQFMYTTIIIIPTFPALWFLHLQCPE
jgi:hypothetical protein